MTTRALLRSTIPVAIALIGGVLEIFALARSRMTAPAGRSHR